ncbi:hypothetical protein VdG1_00839 [Verticillium dahliae VDG1]|nr:hypothetical protein VdG1_00839 [Verticillium dahliae VDG1]
MRLSASIAAGLAHAGLAAAQLAYADNQVTVLQDEDHVATNFPDVEGLELFSPAFVSPDTVPKAFANGTSGPTDELTMDHFLRTLAARNDYMTYHNPSFQSEEGRSLPYIYLSTSEKPGGSGSLKSYANSTRSNDKVRIWMQGGVHGNEPAGDQALLALLGQFDANATWAASILEHVELLVLPRYNPDGLARQQTRDIKKLVMDYAPHVGVDCHEYTATRAYGASDQWHAAQDGQFSAMKNLNIHADIRELSETLFADSIAAAMESRGLRWSPYVTGNAGSDDVVLDETSSDAKMGDTSVGLSQAVMFLTETRGIRLADQHWQRRVATGLTMVQALVQTAADNAKLVHDTVERARADFISSDEDIVITDYAKATNIPGPNLTRSRPQAYVFSRAWHDVADRLQAAGVVVDELYGDFEGQVEALNVTSSTVATSKYEGVVRTTVTTESVSKGVKIPAGGYWVSTRQKNAAHAFNVLEPENIDSYVTFNILPVDVGDEYQVYRVPV